MAISLGEAITLLLTLGAVFLAIVALILLFRGVSAVIRGDRPTLTFGKPKIPTIAGELDSEIRPTKIDDRQSL